MKSAPNLCAIADQLRRAAAWWRERVTVTRDACAAHCMTANAWRVEQAAATVDRAAQALNRAAADLIYAEDGFKRAERLEATREPDEPD